MMTHTRIALFTAVLFLLAGLLPTAVSALDKGAPAGTLVCGGFSFVLPGGWICRSADGRTAVFVSPSQKVYTVTRRDFDTAEIPWRDIPASLEAGLYPGLRFSSAGGFISGGYKGFASVGQSRDKLTVVALAMLHQPETGQTALLSVPLETAAEKKIVIPLLKSWGEAPLNREERVLGPLAFFYAGTGWRYAGDHPGGGYLVTGTAAGKRLILRLPASLTPALPENPPEFRLSLPLDNRLVDAACYRSGSGMVIWLPLDKGFAVLEVSPESGQWDGLKGEQLDESRDFLFLFEQQLYATGVK
jgi:hypothetical protein